MNIVSLQSLYSKTDVKSIRSQNRILEIACLDPAVNLALRFSSVDSLWECDYRSVLDMHRRCNSGAEEAEKINTVGTKIHWNQCDSDLEQYYLILHKSSIDSLRELEHSLISFFSSMIRVKTDGSVVEVSPSDDNGQENIFVLCNPDKISSQINIDDYYQFSGHGVVLNFCVDTFSTSYEDELHGILPELFKIPEYIQGKMKVFPKKYKNRPERLGVLIDVFREFWASENLGSISDTGKVSINERVERSLGSNFKRLLDVFGDERKVGNKLLKFAVRVVEPDCLKKGKSNISGDIYNGVPIRLWILHCVAEYYWRGLDRENISAHAEGTHIEKVLELFGSSGFYSHSTPLDKGINITTFEDARLDYQEIMVAYSELQYFPKVSFGSDCSFAASIIRPSWAKTKSGGGGSGSYGELRSKGRESHVRIAKGKPGGEWWEFE